MDVIAGEIVLCRFYFGSPSFSVVEKKAYELRNEMTDIFEQSLRKQDAQKRIQKWEQKVIQSGLSC